MEKGRGTRYIYIVLTIFSVESIAEDGIAGELFSDSAALFSKTKSIPDSELRVKCESRVGLQLSVQFKRSTGAPRHCTVWVSWTSL